MSFLAAGPETYAGKVFSTGHCVPYVRQLTGAPHTSEWRKGQPVLGNDIPVGTAIATFGPGPDGRYENRVDGSSHAAILIEDLGTALRVWDCWVGRPVGERTIRDKHGAGLAVDDASAYYVIEVV